MNLLKYVFATASMLLFFPIFCCGAASASDEIAHLVNSWDSSSLKSTPEVLDDLSAEITRSIPDVNRRQTALLDYMNSNDPAAPYMAGALWSRTAAPEQRARFLVNAIQSPSSRQQLGYVSSLVTYDLISEEYRNTELGLTLAREIAYNGGAFRKYVESKEGLPLRIAASWFHLSPELALQAFYPDRKNIKDMVAKVHVLRKKIEYEKFHHTPNSSKAIAEAYRELEPILVSNLDSGDPALQMFSASVLSSIFIERSPGILASINKASEKNAVIDALLTEYGITTTSLEMIPSSSRLTYSGSWEITENESPSEERVLSASEPTTTPGVVRTSETGDKSSSPQPAEQEQYQIDATASSAFQWIPVGIGIFAVLLAAAIAIFFKLRGKRQ